MNSLFKVLILLTALVHLANTETTTKYVLMVMAKCLTRHNLSNYGVVGHDGHSFVLLVDVENQFIVLTSSGYKLCVASTQWNRSRELYSYHLTNKVLQRVW